MSRITGSDAASLMEAYAAVYAPQELTEEQVWEEVENWVNSLVEEGYDLSEYTWEDMYEAYLNEAPMTAFQAGGGQAALAASAQRRNVRGGRTATVPTKTRAQIEAQGQQNLYKAGGGDAAIAKGPTRSQNVRGGGTRQVPTLSRQDIINRGAAAAGSTPKPATPAPAPAPRPAAPAPTRPAAPAPTRPVVSTTPTTTTPATTTPAAPVRTPNPLMQRTFGYQTGQAPSQIASTRAATTTAASNLSGTGALAVKPTATATPTASASKPNMQQQIRQRRLNMDLDLFDIVQGYLLDEGYAETEEAAAVIMANMSEEWKKQILESGYFPTKESQRKDEAKYKKGGLEVKHRDIATQSPKPSR